MSWINESSSESPAWSWFWSMFWSWPVPGPITSPDPCLGPGLWHVGQSCLISAIMSWGDVEEMHCNWFGLLSPYLAFCPSHSPTLLTLSPPSILYSTSPSFVPLPLSSTPYQLPPLLSISSQSLPLLSFISTTSCLTVITDQCPAVSQSGIWGQLGSRGYGIPQTVNLCLETRSHTHVHTLPYFPLSDC